MTIDDFRNYKPILYTDKLMVPLNDKLRMYTLPPPSGGVLVAFIIRTMLGWFALCFVHLHVGCKCILYTI